MLISSNNFQLFLSLDWLYLCDKVCMTWLKDTVWSAKVDADLYGMQTLVISHLMISMSVEVYLCLLLSKDLNNKEKIPLQKTIKPCA